VEAALAATVAGLAARPRRVLIVDDDALARKILSDAFTERGFETMTAADGDAGLRKIVDELLALDAVVTDVHMPGLAGDALISAVRQAGGEAELVLVAVTADATQEVVDRLMNAGADAVLSKEAGPEMAIAEVQAALKRHASPRRRARPIGPATAPGAPADDAALSAGLGGPSCAPPGSPGRGDPVRGLLSHPPGITRAVPSSRGADVRRTRS
jgi:DNA-binding response OmpR family regulator